MVLGEHYSALVCERGHVIDSEVNARGRCKRKMVDKFCEQCGSQTLDACPACDVWIRGAPVQVIERQTNYLTHETAPEIHVGQFAFPYYCYQCGAAYPWTEIALRGIREIATQDETLTESEVEELTESAEHLAAETESPDAVVHVGRFKRIGRKLGPDAYEAVMKIAGTIASEAIKKQIM